MAITGGVPQQGVGGVQEQYDRLIGRSLIHPWL